MKIRSLAASVAVLVAGLGWMACSSSDHGPKEKEKDPPPTNPLEKVNASESFVQDLWVYEGMTFVAESGESIDLAEAILAAFEREPSAVVKLAEEVSFAVYDGLKGRVLSADGKRRADVHVDVGFIDAPEGRAFAVLATPTTSSAEPISARDEVEFDLEFLEGGPRIGDPIFLDYAFVQGVPYVGEPESGSVSALELFAARLNVGSFQFIGAEEEEAVRVFDSGPTKKPIKLQPFQPGQGGKSPGGGSSGRHPAKSKGMSRGGSAPDCSGWRQLKCIADSFTSFGGSPASGPEAGACNGNPGKCKQGPNAPPPKTPKSPEGPRGKLRPACKSKRCGGSTGDPHLFTFDNHRYDLHAVGEFVAARSDGLEVQIRTAPIGDSRSIAINTGVAIGVGEHRLTIVVEDGGRWVMRMDGETLVLPEDPSVIDEMDTPVGHLFFGSEYFQVETADGLAVTGIGSIFGGSAYIDVYIDAADRDIPWAGLFGDGDGDPSNDLKDRDGQVFADLSAFRDFYDQFVASWRISDEESLFDYPAGKGTAAFTDLSFPEAALTASSFSDAEQARAEAVCRAAGIIQESLLESCMLDWLVTGEIGMLQSHQFANYVEAGIERETQPGLWGATASGLRGEDGKQFVFACSPGGEFHAVWGTDVYTDDSSVCTAAVHAGKIEQHAGGRVTIEIRPGQESYEGSERNGVTSQEWGDWSGSFVFP